MDESQVADRSAANLRIFFRLRGLQELGRIARKEERLENLPANIRGSLRLVQLFQFARTVDQAELTDGFAAQRLVFLTLGGGEETFVIAADHVAAKDGVLHGSIVTRGVNLRQRFPRFGSTEDPQIFDCFALQLGIVLSARHLCQNLSYFWPSALCRHE